MDGIAMSGDCAWGIFYVGNHALHTRQPLSWMRTGPSEIYIFHRPAQMTQEPVRYRFRRPECVQPDRVASAATATSHHLTAPRATLQTRQCFAPPSAQRNRDRHSKAIHAADSRSVVVDDLDGGTGQPPPALSILGLEFRERLQSGDEVAGAGFKEPEALSRGVRRDESRQNPLAARSGRIKHIAV